MRGLKNKHSYICIHKHFKDMVAAEVLCTPHSERGSTRMLGVD